MFLIFFDLEKLLLGGIWTNDLHINVQTLHKMSYLAYIVCLLFLSLSSFRGATQKP